MKKKVEIALLKSRVHWWRIHGLPVDEIGADDAPYADNCALCEMFLSPKDNCGGCPIAKTAPRCNMMIYEGADDAFAEKDQFRWEIYSREMAEFLDELYAELTNETRHD